MASITGAGLDSPSSDPLPAATGSHAGDPRAGRNQNRGVNATEVEQRYERLIANSPVGQAICEVTGRLVEVNPAWADLLGCTVEEVIGRRAAEFVHPDDQPALQSIVDDLLAESVDHVRSERRLRRKDGSWVWVSSSITVERDAEGRPKGFQSFIVDISEQKLAEEALSRSERRYRKLVDESPVAQVVMQVDGTLLEVNHAFETLMRSTAAELLAVPPDRLLHPSDHQAMTEELAKLLRGEVTYFERERRLVRPDGSVVCVLGGTSLLRDGDELHIHSVLQDITERRGAEEALRESERRLRDSEARSRAVIGSLHEGVIVHDFDRVIDANDSAKRIIGVPPGEELTLEFLASAATVHGDGRPAEHADRPSIQALVSGQPQYDVLRGVQRPSGEMRWCLLNAVPLFHPDSNEPYCVVLSFSDITDRKTAEDELRESEARFRTLAESLPVGVYHTDASGVPVYVNPRWFTISEMSEHELGDVPKLALVHPDDRKHVAELLSSATKSRDPFHLQYRIVPEAGRVKWVSARGAPILDDEHAISGFVGSIEDISPLVEAQEETERLASIVESTSDMVGIVDSASGRVLYMNRAGREMLGDHDPAAGPPTVADVFTDNAQETLRGAVMPALARGDVWSGELDMRGSDGGVVQVWLNLVGHRDNDGHLQHISAVGRDVTERRRAAEVLTHQATHDSLTDLPNRTLLLAELEDALASARAHGTLLALLFLDLDRFKGVNDSLGHDAGDELLIEAARRISHVLRPGDLVARLGGDEFVVVCRDVNDDKQATAIAQRITTTLETEPIVLGTHELSITASVGVALSDGGFAHPESLLRDADAAMYRAKDLGRARLELFDESMRRRTLGRVEVADQLALAIESGQIAVYFQPCYSIKDGRLTSVEALARWNHPSRGLLLPKEFIEVAEETGQIVGLGLQVLTRACQQGHEWELLLGDNAPRVNVNLSARQLSASNIPDLVDGVLQRSKLSPHKLCLEITESTLMEDAPVVIDTLWALKALGVILAIDDFGTGYSSLSYLRKFPVDVIKVDQSFIDGLGPDPEDSAIVAAIIGLAHTLELEAVAEGVETPEQLERLRELGCHAAQGFMFAEPQLADDITPLLTVFDAADRLRQR
ncbi:MAG: PAS domain S-box protein [Actinobacteria bacterium]|nr:PAS domain S-box protein [Actinomycetota bacterium]